jgi:prepilin-type N-terminal cleavage/methylation domain-containing protein
MKNAYLRAFTLVEIMIVVAIIGLLAAIAIPNFVHARQGAQTNACINNLRQIDGAKHQWALEEGKGPADLPSGGQIKPYLGRGGGSVESVYCPLTNSGPLLGYELNTMSSLPICLQFDAAEHASRMD